VSLLDREEEKHEKIIWVLRNSTRVYPKVFGLADWSENCKWYSYLPLGEVVLLFRESF
jgi:hypothetical protein